MPETYWREFGLCALTAMAVSDGNWPAVSSHQIDAAWLRSDVRFARKVFNEAAEPDDFRKLALEYNVQAFLVLSRDAVWNHDALADSPYYRKAYDSKHYRIYVRPSGANAKDPSGTAGGSGR